MDIAPLLQELGVDTGAHAGADLTVRTPIDGSVLATLRADDAASIAARVAAAHAAFAAWRDVPAPRRGELRAPLRRAQLRRHKAALGRLVTLESGKILQEGLGEVQEMIDICDFAVGLSRQLYGLTIASERPGHRMMETWHPLGVGRRRSAPSTSRSAVWSWNAALALVCGDAVVWKPSEKTPLTALACQALLRAALAERSAGCPTACRRSSSAAPTPARRWSTTRASPLVSATGSTRDGPRRRRRASRARFGRTLLELGGNNALIVAPSADLDLAVRGDRLRRRRAPPASAARRCAG